MQLEQTTDGGRTWTAVSPAATFVATGATTGKVTAALDLNRTATYQFRATATDKAANASTPIAGAVFRMTMTDDNTGVARFSGSWSIDKAAAGAFTNSLHSATAPQAGKTNTALFTFTGSEVALVSALGPDRGQVTISVDGGAAKTIDLYAPTVQQLTLVGSVSGLSATTHTLTVNVLPTRNPASTGTRVDVDAFVVK
jgi:hypothetical protein